MSNDLVCQMLLCSAPICILLAVFLAVRPVTGERLTLARLVNEHDAASSMRFGFLQTVTVLCLCALIGVCMRFDCTAFWSCLGGSFTAAFAAKGWQRATELAKEEDEK